MLDPAAARRFHELHREGLLRLPNAWDAGSARLVESLGAKAIATTSAGVAWAHGYPDGDALPVARLLETVRAIARVVRVPISVDIEGGYAESAAGVAEVVAAVIDAGGVGINLEDGERAPDELCRRIEAAREAAERAGVELFINARVDVYLRALATPEARRDEAVARGRSYAEAGASGIFVPALVERGDIGAVADALPLPLNVLAWPGLPGAAELEGLGVRRLSAGSGVSAVLYARAAELVRAFLEQGAVAGEAMPYGEINALFEPG